MHLLMTTDTVGGVWTYALQLVEALAAFDVHVSLATMGARLTSDQRSDARRLTNAQLFESSYRLEWMENGLDDCMEAGAWLQQVARQVRPDLVHLNQFAFGALHWEVPCLVVGHSCVLSWHQSVRGRPAGRQWEAYRDVVTRGLRSADAVVAPTKAMMKMLARYYGPFRKFRTILNGRHSAYGQRREKEPFVLSAGRVWDEAKNIAAVVAVAPQLSWPVRVAGWAQVADEPNCDLPWHHGLHWLGRLSAQQMEEMYSRASIYALPARYEPFGLTPLEAALAGCALVLGDIPTLREVWGEAALFIPPDDHCALAGTIEELISNPNRRRSLVARSITRARQLNEMQMASAYLRTYHELLNHRQGLPPAAADLMAREVGAT